MFVMEIQGIITGSWNPTVASDVLGEITQWSLDMMIKIQDTKIQFLAKSFNIQTILTDKKKMSKNEIKTKNKDLMTSIPKQR